LKYNIPSWWLWYLEIDNEIVDSDSKNIISFRDVWSNADGQSLYINWNTIYNEITNIELNREEEINYWESNLLNIKMTWYTSNYWYTKRYIKELWIKK